MKKKKNIHHLKTKSDEYYALELAKDIIRRNAFYTLMSYIIWSWETKPKIKKMDLLNATTNEYLQEQIKKQKGKYDKNNIIRFDINKLN
jgi:hypothetical protein